MLYRDYETVGRTSNDIFRYPVAIAPCCGRVYSAPLSPYDLVGKPCGISCLGSAVYMPIPRSQLRPGTDRAT